jgi:hypothetical protein
LTQNERPILDGMPLVSPIKMGYKSYNKGDKMKKQTTKDLLRSLLNKTTHLKENRADRLCMMGYLLGAFNIMSCRELRAGIISRNESDHRFRCVDKVENVLESAALKLKIKS